MRFDLAKSEEELKFLYNTRTNPEVDKMLDGEPPKDYESHVNYINKVQGKTRYIFVAKKDDTCVGYTQIYDIRDNQLEVGFVVSPKHQGKGFGKKLVSWTLFYCKKKFPDKKFILYVKTNNDKAIHIYSTYGFVEVSRSEDSVLMELS